jgi:hypothetical protein
LFRLFLGSSAVEHSTVNRMVAGSNPARGANNLTSLPRSTTNHRKPVSALCLQTSCAATGAAMDGWIIGVAIIVALFIALRLALRFYFPPDT